MSSVEYTWPTVYPPLLTKNMMWACSSKNLVKQHPIKHIRQSDKPIKCGMQQVVKSFLSPAWARNVFARLHFFICAQLINPVHLLKKNVQGFRFAKGKIGRWDRFASNCFCYLLWNIYMPHFHARPEDLSRQLTQFQSSPIKTTHWWTNTK